MVLLVLHLALRGSSADLDSFEYLRWYSEISKLSSGQFFNELDGWYFNAIFPQSFEWGFALLAWTLGASGASEGIFLGVVAAISLGLKYRPLLRYCPSPFLGLLWYVSWYYILLEMNAVRAGIAAGFLLTAVAAMLEKRWRRFFLCVFLASSFHTSALIGLLFPFLLSERLGRKSLITLLAVSIAVGYVSLGDIVGFSGNLIPKLTEYADLLTLFGVYEEINRFNAIALVRIALALVLIWKLSTFAERSTTLAVGIRAYVLCQAMYYAFASFPIVGSRISQLMGVLDVLVVPAIAVLLRPRLLWLPFYLLICAIQFYALSLHFQLADFFYFVGEPRVVVP